MQRRTILLLLFVVISIGNLSAQAQDCRCKDDLLFLNEKIRKAPAYKENQAAYESSYSNALKKVGSVTTIYDCHILLNTLLLALNDNHSRVYSVERGATAKTKESPDELAEFENSNLFRSYPKPTIDLDSLRTVLQAKAKEDIAGIYTGKNYFTLGVYKSENANEYNAIVLDTETKVWRVGEVVCTLIPFGNDYLLSAGGSPSSKRLMAYTERIGQGLFYFMGFTKDRQQTNFSTEVVSEDTYHRKELSDEITYLKIGSFNAWRPTLSEAEEFYQTLEDNLNKKNLIVDLRNNGGGGDRNSDILYKIIKKYAKKNRVYVLINHRTASNAEQFAYRLRKRNNARLLGQRTNGSIAYEIKDDSHTLPCGNFIAVLTSKKHAEYLEFESQGVAPDVMLATDSDWVDQVKEHIEKRD